MLERREVNDVERRMSGDAQWRLGRFVLPHPVRIYTICVSAAFIVVGTLGLLASPGMHERDLFNLFALNGPHSSVHLIIGLLGIWCYLKGYSLQFARANALLFGMLTVAGFLPQPLFGVISIGGPDMFLHGATALLGETVSRVEEYRELRADEALLRFHTAG